MLLLCYNKVGDNMQCPNCKYPINDNAKICIHCGTMFSKESNDQQKQQDSINKTEYLNAYSGGKYFQIVSSRFSWQVLLFGKYWLLTNRLYKDALIWFGLQVLLRCIEVVATFIWIYKTLFGMHTSEHLYKGILVIITIIIHIVYSTKYSHIYAEEANSSVNEIMEKTTNEEERIELCKQAGKPLYLFLIIPIMLLILFTMIAFLSIFTKIDLTTLYG